MEYVATLLAGYFCQRNDLEVHLILFGKSPSVFYKTHERLVIHKPETEFNDRYRILYTIGRLIFVRQTVKKIKPKSALSFGEYWNNLVLLSLIGTGIPVFVSDRSRPGKNLGLLHNTLRYLLYKRARGYIAQTNYAADIARVKGWNENIRVIGNPIRISECQKHAEREKIVLSVGRLVKTKHFDMLIKLFVEIADPEWKLIIVGGNAQKQNNLDTLSQLIRSLNAEDRVILVGTQSETGRYYCKSSLFAFMSSSEGFPNVIGEALSAGLPVVAYDCIAGPGELISDGVNGFLIPLFDYNLFKQKLKLLMDDDNLRTQFAANTAKNLNYYNIDTIGKAFMDFINPA